MVGTEVDLRVSHIGKSNKCYAARVTGVKHVSFLALFEGYQSINKFPHITLCVSEGAKPVQSNYIEDWVEVKEEIIIRGALFRKCLLFSGSVAEFGVYLIENGTMTSSPNRSSPGGRRNKKDHFPNRSNNNSNNNSPTKNSPPPEKMPPKGIDWVALILADNEGSFWLWKRP